MESPTTLTTQNPEPRRLSEAGTSGTPVAAATDDIDAAYPDERHSRGPWSSEAPPTGVLTGVSGELAFYYGACWRHHRSSTPPSRGMMR
jgi:hypothetical protein